VLSHAFRMKLKPGASAEYRRRHDALWPELASALRDAGIYDYSIFLDEETLHLFAVLKLRPDNARDQLPQHPLMRRWWSYMADLMETDLTETDLTETDLTQTEPNHRPREWPLVPMFHLE
jgi:L-rhamnose mutarotase